jgi:lactate dehydrogenase-like 2-hydroxyacid dehydrogenase
VEERVIDSAMPKQELLQKIQGKQAILCTLTEIFDKEVLRLASGVKIIANCAVGYNNIDISTATKLGIMVTNTPDVLTDATAEMAWSLLFACARNVVPSYHCLKTGQFTGWSPTAFLGGDITGKTLGIVGAGRIGTAMALKSRGFSMPVLYYSNHSNAILEEELQAKRVSLEQLCVESDYISIHLPANNATYHLLNAQYFSMMKPTTYVVNTGRGEIIDEIALIDAVEKNTIAGAGLDVFENEPHINPKLLAFPNIVVTTHIGSATRHTRQAMVSMAVRNIIAAVNGEIPPNLINSQ